MNLPLRRIAGIASLAFVLLPRPVFAGDEAKNCVTEPTDMAIAYGDVLLGAGCLISPSTDVDIFRFSGSAGEVVRVVGSTVVGPGTVRVQVLDPDGASLGLLNPPVIVEGGSGWRYFTLQKTGTYSVVVYEVASDETVEYGLTLERIAPPGPDAVPLTLTVASADELNPGNDIDLFRFHAAAGSQIRISLDPQIVQIGQHLQVHVARPSGVLYTLGEFTSPNPFFFDIPITETGDHTIQLRPYRSNMDPFGYTIRIDCLSGPCAPPDCTLEIEPTFADTTLTLDLTVGNRLSSASWHVWLWVLNETVRLWSFPIGVISPDLHFAVPIPGFPSLGKVAILSSITTPTGGIACFDAETVDTGSVAGSASIPSASEILRGLKVP